MKSQGLPAVETWALYGVHFNRSSFRSSAEIITKLDDKLPGRVQALWSNVAGGLRSKGLKLKQIEIENMLSAVGDPVIEFYGNSLRMMDEFRKSGSVTEAERILQVAKQYLRKGKMPKKVEAFYRETLELKTTPATHLKAFSQVWNRYRDREFEIDELAVRYVEATKLGNAMEKELERVLHLDSRFQIQLTKLRNTRRKIGTYSDQ